MNNEKKPSEETLTKVKETLKKLTETLNINKAKVFDIMRIQEKHEVAINQYQKIKTATVKQINELEKQIDEIIKKEEK